MLIPAYFELSYWRCSRAYEINLQRLNLKVNSCVLFVADARSIFIRPGGGGIRGGHSHVCFAGYIDMLDHFPLGWLVNAGICLISLF